MTTGAQLQQPTRHGMRLGRSHAPGFASRGNQYDWQVIGIAAPIFFLLGSALNAYAFDSFQPALTALLFFAPVWGIVAISTTRTPAIRLGFGWLLAFYWFCAGLTAIWDARDDLSFISFTDADHFYSFIFSGRIDSDLEILNTRSVGALAILIWDWCYRLASGFGLGYGAYIGIVVNILFMAGTSVVSAQMLGTIIGYNPKRYLTLFLAFSFNGLFILFAVSHIRDAFVCFAITFFVSFWARFLTNRTIYLFFLLIPMSILCFFTLRYLRSQFQFLPIGLLGAAILSLMIAKDGPRSQRMWSRILGIGAAFGLLVVLQTFGSDMSSAVDNGREGYSRGAVETATNQSLGLALVVNQPLPIRLIFGSAYSILMPLPVWAELGTGSIYHLCKSLGAIFAYFLVPALLARAWCMLKIPRQRVASVIFLLTIFTSFLMATSISSMEGRHVAAFMPLAIVATLAGSTEIASYRIARARIQFCLLTAIGVAHLVWIMIKLF